MMLSYSQHLYHINLLLYHVHIPFFIRITIASGDKFRQCKIGGKTSEVVVHLIPETVIYKRSETFLRVGLGGVGVRKNSTVKRIEYVLHNYTSRRTGQHIAAAHAFLRPDETCLFE